MDFLNHIIETDTYQNLLYFVLGGLFVLFSYHFIRYLGNEEKPYLYYSLYALCSFLAYMTVAENGIFRHLSDFFGWNTLWKDFFTTLYNGLYFLFFASFLDLKKHNRRNFDRVTQPVYILLALSFLFFIATLIFGNPNFFEDYKTFFIVCISLHTITSFVILMKIRNRLKWYIIIGGVLLFITSIIGEEAIRKWIHISYKEGDFIFFMGLFVENMLFSLALGHKHRREFQEREIFQANLIRELKNNEILREEITKRNEEKLLSANEKIRMQRENSHLALAALRSQINPHFIFNALHSIKLYMLSNDKDNAVEYLNKFSRFIRLILSSSFERESTLQAELEILKLYLDIENLRFGGEMLVSVTVDEYLDTKSVVVPPLFLQPFLENAIWHGIAASPEKKIWLEARKTNRDDLEISIRDSGIGFEKAAKQQSASIHKGKSFGLRIAEDSLKKFFSGRYRIRYVDNQKENPKSTGITVIITIPMQR